MKIRLKLVVISALFLIALIVSACGGTGTPSLSGANTGNTAHMGDSQFVQTSITVHKGESVQLVNDVGFPHIIANGAWNNGTANAAKENGAPAVDSVQVAGGATQAVGPFNTAGTFHLYCTIHAGMNLTVVVQ